MLVISRQLGAKLPLLSIAHGDAMRSERTRPLRCRGLPNFALTLTSLEVGGYQELRESRLSCFEVEAGCIAALARPVFCL